MRSKQPTWRSMCPLNIALEMLGDRWTLLILRDLIFMGRSTFKDFQLSGESIATNILSNRLRMLQEQGIIEGRRSEVDARVMDYRPTDKGLDLLPVMTELIVWADRYELTAAPPELIKRLRNDRDGFIAEVRAKLKQRK